MAQSSEQRKTKGKLSGDHLKILYTEHGRGQAGHNRSPGEAQMPSVLAIPRKEEVPSAIPSSQRQAVMDHGHSPNGEEVVLDTSQVVVGSSQKGEEAVGCQPIRPCEEEEKEG